MAWHPFIDRPCLGRHRMARLLHVPDYIRMRTGEVCDVGALQAVAAMSEPHQSTSSSLARVSPSRTLDFVSGHQSQFLMDAYLMDLGFQFERTAGKDRKGNAIDRFILHECPFNPDHKSPDVYCFHYLNGGFGFHCSHTSCGSNDWHAFKQRFGEPKPEHWDPPKRQWQPTYGTSHSSDTQSSNPTPVTERTFAGKSAADLWELSNQPVEWLVEGVFSAHQPTVVGAKQKSLKTTLMADLAVSLVSGLPWLGKFNIPQKRRVLVITGESSEAAAIRKIRRAAESRNLRREDFADSLRIEAITFPTLPSINDCEAVAAAINEHHIDVVILDPLYMALQGINTANLNEVGPAMRRFMAHCQPANVIIAHHVKKTASFDDAPNLEDLSQAGIAEFAGNFWLMGRMSEYTGDGLHHLAIRYGGRDEQFGLLKLDFDERAWTAEFASLIDHREDLKARQETERFNEQVANVKGYLNRHDGEAPLAALAEAAGMKPRRESFQAMIDELCSSGQYERCTLKSGNNRKCDGLKVKGQISTDTVR